MDPATLPYCGAPPLPGAAGWNLDPVLLAALLLALPVLWRGARPGGRGLVLGGWAVLALALVSPLCSLSVALFSARVAQHLLIVLVAAPLLAAGWRDAVRPPGAAGLLGSAGAFALALWTWHLPLPYAATFASTPAYWAMHLTLLASAAWLWRGLWQGASSRPELAFAAGIGTAAQSGLLGAMLTLAPRPLFAPHAGTTLPWGLTPLEDQQLGGLLMWVPGGLAFAVLAVAAAAALLRPIAHDPVGRAPRP
ncbi:cytochrome c oxidase assembly protein [Roseomonas sp. OT10]|uniref:cytochrome c oxidase assembly protein n=1 Tax=Roseomonas cutis TaxID=2897332 RepID=UPI001E564F87|nr:cytochrome c oxidase assembly protein [Roseomonas sp. OT10]UFN49996.1 cytochrome c oxidase assembly protein [Roseomonas sp. OT10]